MKTLHADLLAKQIASNIQPAIQAVFTSRDGATTYNYSFDPTVTTNRLEDIEYREEPFDDYAVFTLRNDDLAVPNLVGYYVDLGIGANTDSGLRYGVYPRLWVKRQHRLSGGTKGQRANLKSVLELQGVWNMLRELFVLIGSPPVYQDNYGELSGKTIYGMLEYLIETSLYAMTGSVFSFTLDALGDQDDTVINSLVLEPTHDANNPFLNQNAPNSFETFADVFERILRFTGCYLRVKSGLALKAIYPQATDAINETYYSSLSNGHVFYENTERYYVKVPNRVKVFSKQGDTWDVLQKTGTASATLADHLVDTTKSQFNAGDVGKTVYNVTDGTQAEVIAYNSASDLTLSSDIFISGEGYNVFPTDTYIQGEAFSTDWDLSQIPWTFTGQYVPILEIVTDSRGVISDEQTANKLAKFILDKHSAETFGGRIVVPHDARVELYDRVAVSDARGT